MEEEDGPWPREFFVQGDIIKELKEDGPALKAFLDSSIDQVATHHGVKLAPGEEWRVRWVEVTEHEVKINESINGSYWLSAGDWHFRAEARVTKI